MHARDPYGGLGEGLSVLAFRDIDDETLARFHALLETAFTSTELMTLEEFRAARQSPTTNGTVLLRDDEPLAGIVTEDYQNGRIVLLAYLIVAVPARNCGLGSQLLAGVMPRDAGPDRPLLLAEIEDPRIHRSSDRGDPVARLRFYDRSGARLLPLPYCQPSLRPGSPRVDGMLLVAIGAQGRDIDGHLVASFLEEYYETCEGKNSLHDDPAFAALREMALGDVHGRLTLHPLLALDVARSTHGPAFERQTHGDV